jgi:hypothetical protein
MKTTTSLKGVGLWKELDQVKRILIAVLIVSGIIHSVSIWAIVRMSYDHKVMVQIPAGTYGGTNVIVGNNKGYMELWANHFLSVISEYSPSNYEDKADYILSHSSTEGEANLRKKLLDTYDEIKRVKAYQSFHPDISTFESVWITKELWKFSVRGRTVIETEVVSEKKTTYEGRKYFILLEYMGNNVRIKDFGYEKI